MHEYVLLDPNMYMASGIQNLLRNGLIKLVRSFFKVVQKQEASKLNDLYAWALQDQFTDLPKGTQLRSVLKKGVSGSITPAHFAAINPNPLFFQKFCEVAEFPNSADTDLPQRSVCAAPDYVGVTPLHYAAASESTEVLRYIHHLGIDITVIVTKQKMTALMFAAAAGRHENVEFIISVLEDKSRNKETFAKMINAKDKFGKGALHWACENGHEKFVKILLKNGADAEQEGGSGSQKYLPIVYAAQFNRVKVLNTLLELAGSNQIGHPDKHGRLPIHHAVKNGNFDFVKILILRGSPVNAVDSSFNSVLHYAAAYGWLDCVTALVESGSEINALNDWKLSPLTVALIKGNVRCWKYLLSCPSTDISIRDSDGKTALHHFLLSPFCTADNLKTLLGSLGKQVKNIVQASDMNLLTPLHIWCEKVISKQKNFEQSEEEVKEAYRNSVEIAWFRKGPLSTIKMRKNRHV